MASYRIDTEESFLLRYQLIYDLIKVGVPSEVIELVPGESQSLFRLWQLPVPTMQAGVLESVYQAIVTSSTETLKRDITAILEDWLPFYLIISNKVDANTRLTSDGQVMRIIDLIDLLS